MTVTITFPNENHAVPAVRVYLRTDWFADWEEKEFLYCDSCQFAANPHLALAQLSWRYGSIQQAGSSSFDEVDRLDSVLRAYVKIEIDDPDSEGETIDWHGILETDSAEQNGILGALAFGKQSLTAYGLDILLQRHVLTTSMAEGPDGDERTIDRGLEFNARAQIDGTDKDEAPNRSALLGARDACIFAHDLASADFWSTLDIAKYLLAYQAPPDEVDDIAVQWQLDVGQFFGVLPDFDKPRMAAHARSLKQLLDQLLDRRRLLGYTVEVDPGAVDEEGDPVDPDKIQLRCFTFTPVDIDFDGDTIPANSAQKALVFESDAGVQAATLKRSTLDAYDQVICTGERIVACFTIRADLETLVSQWTDEQETEYGEGASGQEDYAEAEKYDQQASNRRVRHAHRLHRVYAFYGLPTDWDGMLDGAPYFPNLPNDEANPLPFYMPQLRFLHHLPLKTDHDYTDDAIADDVVEDNTPDGQKWEYLPIIAAIKVPDGSGKYARIDRLASTVEMLDPDGNLIAGPPWSASARPQDDAPGIVLTVHGGEQHVLAGGGSFVPLSADDEDVSNFDWEDNLVATVAMKVDRHVSGVWPADNNLPATQVMRRLIVDLGDEFKQHYVAQGTVVAVADDGTLATSSGGLLRDDSDKLQALARLIYQWYALDRQSLELSLAYVTGKLVVGDLITTVGSGADEITVNSVVTGVKYQFPEQQGSRAGAARTTITTEFAELDAKHFLSHGRGKK